MFLNLQNGCQSIMLPVTENFDFRSVVESGNGLHQVAGRMISEVGRNVSDANPSVKAQTPAELERGLVQDADLLDAELRVAVGDGLAELVAQRVEHRVVGVDRRKAVLFELVGHDVYQGFHAGRVVRPVADNLFKIAILINLYRNGFWYNKNLFRFQFFLEAVLTHTVVQDTEIVIIKNVLLLLSSLRIPKSSFHLKYLIKCSRRS